MWESSTIDLETPSRQTGDRVASSSAVPLLLLAACAATRIFASWVDYTLPDMEPGYILTAQAVFEHTGINASYMPVGYPALLYGVNTLFHDWVLTSHVVYVVFSTAAAALMYLLAREIISESIARRVLVLSILLPNFTAAVVGYSHTVVVGFGLLLLTMYAFWQLCDRGDRWGWCVVAALSGGAATLARGESVLAWPLLLLIWFWRRRASAGAGRRFAMAGVMTLIVVAMLFGVSRVAMRIGPGEPIGLLGNARYSYTGYISTLGYRATGSMDMDVATKLGEQAFGPVGANGYSIPRAIRRNPKEALANIVFNVKSLLKEAGHPLFVPVFLLPLVGIGLTGRSAVAKPAGWLLLASVVPSTLFSLILFHVEIRYMMPLTLPLVVLMAAGLDALTSERRWVAGAVYGVTAVLFFAYLAHFHGIRTA